MKKKSSSRIYKTDWAKLEKMTDADIDYSDIPELDESFWKNASIRWPGPKKMVSIRLDEDVIEWFKAQGKGYQTKMNEVLKTYMKAKAA